MEVADLKKQCQDTIDRGGGAVMLVLPGPPGRGESRRLCGKRGPRGEIINVNRSGDSVCRFSAEAVLKFLIAEEG